MSALLDGIKVLDMSQGLSGRYCSMLLAQYGAEVISVRDKDSREMPGPCYQGAPVADTVLDRNKFILRADLKREEGKTLVQKLLEKSQVLLEDGRPGEFAKRFSDIRKLCEERPSLVAASISPFGQTGPLSSRPGTDAVIQAASGLMSMTGTEETGPLMIGISWTDYIAGAYAAYYILVALYHQM